MSIDYLVGDVFDRMRDIPDGSISLVASSPPFIQLRSYLPADHPDKAKEIGSEPDPATFIDTLLALTAEWGRVLAPWGSIAIELGDTFAGSGMGPDGRSYGAANLDAISQGRRNPGPGWPRAKCLALIPQAYALSLAYGRNVLTGQPSPAGQWLVRNQIVWHRPNPAVGALGDKVRPSTSYITVATRSPKRWFDLTAVRTPLTEPAARHSGTRRHAAERFGERETGGPMIEQNAAGAPPLDCWFDEHDTWTITTQPSKLAHYAMWPPKLAERLILMMCPHAVCSICGEPRRRIERTVYAEAPDRPLRPDDVRSYGSIDGKRHNDHRTTTQAQLGWSDCGCSVELWASWADDLSKCRQRRECFARVHDIGCPLRPLSGVSSTMIAEGTGEAPADSLSAAPGLLGARPGPSARWMPGRVLDPFAGTGTTLCVADLHGRDAIGIDIDSRNRDLMPQRMDECRRSLFGVLPELPGQLDMFGDAS